MGKMLCFAFLSIIFAVAYGEEVCENDIAGNLTNQDSERTVLLGACPLSADLFEDDTFTLPLDLQHFKLNEITVKTSNNYLIVEAKNNRKDDDFGIVSRQYFRRYTYPAGTNSYKLVSKFSSDRYLILTAPMVEVDNYGERTVPTTPMGPACKIPRVPKKPCLC